MNIIKPSVNQVSMYLDKWGSLDNYVQQENSLRKLFIETYPLNSDMDDVLIKVCSLNDFYSTNIFSPFNVAKHIVDLDIDQRLMDHDMNVVNDLALVKIGEKTKNFYSFATKYCSHHSPEHYPIFDSYVEKMLIYFNKQDQFASFRRDDLRDYSIYYDVLIKFSMFYQLDAFTLKEIDKYLWLAGKEYFPKKY